MLDVPSHLILVKLVLQKMSSYVFLVLSAPNTVIKNPENLEKLSLGKHEDQAKMGPCGLGDGV